MQKFMRFAVEQKYVKHVEDFEALLEFDTEKITDILEDYVFFMQEEGMSQSEPTLQPPNCSLR